VNDKLCNVCGKPATNAARDVMRHEVPSEMYVQFSPVGGVKYGCDEHPATSEEHLTQLPPERET
jgi:hypothetical protein